MRRLLAKVLRGYLFRIISGFPLSFPLQKTPGEPYPVIPYRPSFFSQLEQNINDVSVGIRRIFDKENAQALKKSLRNLQKKLLRLFQITTKY